MTAVFSLTEYDSMADELTRIGSFERGAVERDIFPDGEYCARELCDQGLIVRPVAALFCPYLR